MDTTTDMPSAPTSTTSPARPVGGSGSRRVRPVVQHILDSMSTPAVVRNARVDYLDANQLGRALYAPLFESREQPANSARFTFLDPAAVDFYTDWERVATDLVAHLRSEAGGNPYDRGLSDLIGELSTHSVVGDLELSYETMDLSADAGLNLAVYTAEAGSASQQALDLLASWTATIDQTAAAGVNDDAEAR